MEMVDVKKLDTENPAVSPSAPERDSVDEKLEAWLREIPELDARTEGIVDRINVLQRVIRKTHDDTLEQFGLSWGEVQVLSSIRYGGAPYQSTPGRLASQLGLSSGAMTARLDKMEEAGLVLRLRDPDDRRGVIIELTDSGRALWEETIAVQAEKEALVQSTLSERDQDRLNDLLRRLVLSFTREYGMVPKRHSP